MEFAAIMKQILIRVYRRQYKECKFSGHTKCIFGEIIWEEKRFGL